MSKFAARLIANYNELINDLSDRDLLKDSNPLSSTTSKKVDPNTNAVISTMVSISWSNKAHLSYVFGEFQSLDDYIQIVEKRDFSVCLSDGSLIQIWYILEDNEIVRHNLGYFPCPFYFEVDEAAEFALAELPLYLGSELKDRMRLVSPIRFDFNKAISDEFHPHAHCTINRKCCRIPVYGPLSFGHFIKFIFRTFYSGEIDDLNSFDSLKCEYFSRYLPAPVMNHELFINTDIR